MNETLEVERHQPNATRHFSLQRVDAQKAPVVVTTGKCTVGSLNINELSVDHATVSRFHCEVGIENGVGWVKDLGSKNGTHVDGLQVKEAFLKDGSLIKLGPTATLRFRVLAESGELHPLSDATELQGLIGASIAMRTCFWQLERAAATSRPVLLEGESGTGKTAAAEVLHALSTRAVEPLITVDCGSVAPADLEEMLFGRNEPPKRISAFEEAGAGTLVLEDVSELPEPLQLRLLPVLETGELRRGPTAVASVGSRLVATTRKDLRTLVNEGRFKSELFYRLAVLRVRMPPLRERPEDIAALVDLHLTNSGVPEDDAVVLRDSRLQYAAWPGNVRELFNHLDRAAVMKISLAPSGTAQHPIPVPVDARLPYAEARRIALERFEASYVKALLELHEGNVSAAARQTGLDRAYLHRLIKRHAVK